MGRAELGRGLSRESSEGKLKHLGITAPARSTLAYANEHRPWQLYRAVFDALLARCHPLARGRRKFRFKNKLVSLDSTVIDLGATLFDWAKFRRTKGAVKLHCLLDHDGYLPRRSAALGAVRFAGFSAARRGVDGRTTRGGAVSAPRRSADLAFPLIPVACADAARLRAGAQSPIERGGQVMRVTHYRYIIVILLSAFAAVAAGRLAPSVAHDDKPQRAASPHVHPAVPASYAAMTAPRDIWTNPGVLAGGQAIHAAKCAVCHGREGDGDGPALAGQAVKPASLRDRAMVAEMTDAYWFWRVSEGGMIEPFKSAGSTMPAWKSDLSVEERWAVVAYQHSLSGHTGPHTVAEHPEMPGTRPHPDPRGVAFTSGVTRDHRWQPRGPWKWTVMRDLPQLYREFNGIDFGHAHLAETLLKTQDPASIEKARLEVVDFIFSSPPVPPDEEQVAPTFNRLAWEVAKAFDWAHIFHRSLYDLFASDKVEDKEAAYRKLLADYLEKLEAITPHRLDHHGALWSFPESKSFRDKFPKFNTQIWAYHWLQAAVYDVQLLGGGYCAGG